MHNIGAGVMEHGLSGMNNGANTFTPGTEAAKAEITELTSDKEFQKKLRHRDPRVRAPGIGKPP
jgi:hypothetical protein